MNLHITNLMKNMVMPASFDLCGVCYDENGQVLLDGNGVQVTLGEKEKLNVFSRTEVDTFALLIKHHLDQKRPEENILSFMTDVFMSHKGLGDADIKDSVMTEGAEFEDACFSVALEKRISPTYKFRFEIHFESANFHILLTESMLRERPVGEPFYWETLHEHKLTQTKYSTSLISIINVAVEKAKLHHLSLLKSAGVEVQYAKASVNNQWGNLTSVS